MSEILEHAFYVEPISEDFDPNVPPSTGQEYIHRVIWEASKCDAVVSTDSPFSTEKTINVKKVPGCELDNSTAFAPSLEWQQCQVSDFSIVRQWVARAKASGVYKSDVPLPNRNDEDGWFSLCFGSEAAISDQYVGPSEGVQPLLSILHSMNQPLIEQVLEYHVDWLETRSFFSERQGCWLYALLACLELPLLPETCSLVRTLARECMKIRETLDSVDHPFMAPLNLIICLVGNYFRQTDLADTK